MSAPGSTPPLLSVITPEMLPVVDCAAAPADQSANTSVVSATRAASRILIR